MPARTWMIRRLLGRVRVDDEVVRRLTGLQRLGDAPEDDAADLPVPAWASEAVQDVRTRAAVQAAPGWVWPHWLERQLDPASPTFVPGGHLPLLANLAHRNWTPVGNLDSPVHAVVDPRGLVTPWPDGWSLDWWIGADDRWHLPSREVGVRQRLVDASPVVETAMSIPSGDAVQRVYAVRRSSAEGGGELVVVEVENASKAPVAVALAVRPYGPRGASVVERIDLRGATVAVDGRVALLLPRPPRRIAGSTLRGGDSARTVLAGEAGERWQGPVHDPDGMAQAAFVYPLAHGASIRVAIPLEPDAPTRRAGIAHRRLVGAPGFPDVVPPAAAVAQGWRAQSDRGLRIVVPDDRLAEAVAAGRRYLLLRAGGRGRTGWRDAAVELGALGRYGYHDEVAEVLATFPAQQRSDGSLGGAAGGWDATGAALVALADHWRLTRDAAAFGEMATPIAVAAHGIDRARRSGEGGARRRRPGRGRGRRRAVDASGRGLLPPRIDGGPLGPYDHVYADDVWGVAGLRAAAEVLRAIDQPDAADDADRFAQAMWADVEASLARTAERLGTPAIPAGPRRGVDGSAAGSLVAVALGLLPAGDDRIAATAEAVREQGTLADGRAVDDGLSGLGTELTLLLAAAELRAGDRRCADRLDWMLEIASPTWTWPEAVHPRHGGGTRGDGLHGPAVAALLTCVRDLLVREVDAADGGPALALSSVVPDRWYGQGWEVHDAPTALGRVSYAVRWHGDRVALLWEVEPHAGGGPVTLVAPGLDRTWSTTEARGEALLGPVPPPSAPPAPPAPATPAGSTGPTPPTTTPPASAPGSSPVAVDAAPEPDGGTFS